jgi:hypothetical protein
MGVFDWIGTGNTALQTLGIEDKNSKFSKYFKGSWSVTVGTAIQGNFGTTVQSYYGPYITHVVDTSFGGVGFLAGQYLNEIFPIPVGTHNQFDSNVLGSLVFGISGYITWVYGPNITASYGGPTGTITRAKSFEKTAYAQAPTKTGLPLGLSGKGTDLTPAGAPPDGVDAVTMANADKKVLLVVNLLSLVLNITVAVTELVVKFAYSSFHSADPNDPTDNETIEQPNPSEDNYPLTGIDFGITLLATRMMAIIYATETAGSFETWAAASAKKAKDQAADIAAIIGISPGTPEMMPWFVKAKTQEGLHMTEDSLDSLMVLIAVLLVILGAAAAMA